MIKTLHLNHGHMSSAVSASLEADKRFEVQDKVNPATLADLESEIKKYKPELLVIGSYLRIIPKKILDLVPKIINIHFGDLPKQKGSSTITWAIIKEHDYLAISIHEVVEQLDSGDIIHKEFFTINKDTTIITLYDSINNFLIKNIANLCYDYYTDNYTAKKQIQSNTTYSCTRIPSDGHINWNTTTAEISRLTKALLPPIMPGAYTYYKNNKLILLDTDLNTTLYKKYSITIPGRVVKIHKNKGIEIFTKDGSIIVTKVLYKNKIYRADELIKSVRLSLGIDLELLLNNE